MAKSSDMDYSKFLFDEVMNITSLAHYARVQAHDAELRARYCMSLAEKAICEAESVHQVSESLTCTSKMVANMTLEYMSSLFHCKESETVTSNDATAEDQDILKTLLKQMETSEKSSKKKKPEADYGQDQFCFLPRRGSPKPDDYLEHEKHFLSKQTKISHTQKKSKIDDFGTWDKNTKSDHWNENFAKFQEQYPEDENKEQIAKDLPKEFDSSHSLPTVYENSYQGAMGGKPVSWTEMKTIKKVQRKLRDIDLAENERRLSASGIEEYPDTD